VPAKFINPLEKHLRQDDPAEHRTVRYVTIEDAAGQRIDNYLLGVMRGVPRSRVYGMLRKGEVRVNRGRVRADYRLEAGDVVRLPPWHAPGPRATAQPPRAALHALERRILFQDDALIVLDKPAGLAVHGGSGVASGVIEQLRVLFPNDRRLELVHRIDRDTSGCLVLARKRSTLLELHAVFREGAVAKTYDALVYGIWPARLQAVRAELTRFVTRSGERRVRVAADGKSAYTEFSVVESCAAASWINAHPHTGRTHQIRVHCTTSGHPIVGDEKYAADPQLNASRALGIQRLCLHATSLELPLGGTLRRFVAPIPADFERAWQALQRSCAS
jgi:23S rRNA pseudouridine955/2504/2580 synthase